MWAQALPTNCWHLILAPATYCNIRTRYQRHLSLNAGSKHESAADHNTGNCRSSQTVLGVVHCFHLPQGHGVWGPCTANTNVVIDVLHANWLDALLAMAEANLQSFSCTPVFPDARQCQVMHSEIRMAAVNRANPY